MKDVKCRSLHGAGEHCMKSLRILASSQTNLSRNRLSRVPRKRESLVLLLLLFTGSSQWFFAAYGISTQGTEKKYLLAFFEFEDLTHAKSIDELREIAVTQVQSYYEQVSYGKLKVTADIVERWIKLPIKVKEMKVFEWDYDQDQMRSLDSNARQALSQLGIGAIGYAIKFVVYAGKVWGHARSDYGMSFMNEFQKTGVYRHELGHVLELPDLYSYRLATEGKPSGVWVGPWDLMSWGGRGGLSAWSLIKVDWIDQERIVDVRGEFEGTFVIDALGNLSGRVHVARVHIPGTSQDYYIEVREKIGADADMYSDWYPKLRVGVLIYLVNAQGDPREGQIRVIDSHPGSYTDPEDDLLDAPFNLGKNENVTMINRLKDVSIIVLGKFGYSYKILLGRASVADKATEANTILVQAEDAVAKAEREFRTNGLDIARAQLANARSAYGQAQFADAISRAREAIGSANAASEVPTTFTTSSATTSSAPLSELPLIPAQPNVLVYAIVAAGIAAGVVLITLRKRKSRR